jgi:hypothetical protein
VIARLWLWLRGVEAVSPAWLDAHAAESTKTGWTDGPVWRTPAELDQMRRRERRAQLSVVRERRAK